MYKKVLLLVKGMNDQAFEKSIELTAGMIASSSKELVIKQTQYKGHAEEICKREGDEFEKIFIIGGDGTVHECINGLACLKKPPIVGVLPGGTCNDFSRALSIPQQLKRAVYSLLNGTVHWVDIGKMNDRFFSNFLGIGLIAEASENINQEWKDMLGKVSYFISALQKFKDTEPFSFRLRLDEQIIEDKAVMVLITNGNFIGTSMLPFPEISLYDGMFDIFVVNEGGANLLREYIHAKNPFILEPEQRGIQYYRSNWAYLETEQPMKADTDGDIYMSTPIELKNVNKKIPFLVS